MKRLQKETGNYDLHIARHTDDDASRFRAVARPFTMLLTQPVMWLLGAYQALIVGVYFLIMYTFTVLWRKGYNQSVSTAGLHYLANTIGFMLGGTASILNDRTYKYMTKKYGQKVPENRMPVMLAGGILVPVGLFLYGWSAYYKTLWIAVDTGLAVYSCGYVVGTISFHTYIIDYYGEYAASATAGVSIFTGLLGFLLPLVGHKLYENIGHGWGNTLMGVLSIIFGVPMPMILWWYGDKLRRKSPLYAARQQGSV
jgi:MFS family permease